MNAIGPKNLHTPQLTQTSAPLALYLHIPFCSVRCTYCAFNLYTRALGRATTQPVATIYFGGGTPSLLDAAQVEQILATCRAAFEVAEAAEITLEANPESVDERYLQAARASGVTRLSIGMQSAQAEDLRLFARQHNHQAVQAAMSAARRAGFDNVSLDLIYGAPQQTLAAWRASVEAALSLEPAHLSMYALILEPGTSMTRSIDRGWLSRPDDDLAADMYELADSLVSAAGLAQYEISTWARPGAMSQHNLHYWRNLPYLGVGAGAHGYAAGMRYEVVRSLTGYIERATCQTGVMLFPLTATVEHHEAIDSRTAMAEHMITGLRLLKEGISVVAFQQRFGVPLDSVYGDELSALIGFGLLERTGDSIRLTARARLISNQVFLRFMADS